MTQKYNMMQKDNTMTNDLELALSGDQDAWSRLVLSNHRSVYRVARTRTGNHDTAMDLTQEVFLLAFRKLDQLKDPDKLPAWLHGIARRVRIKYPRVVYGDILDPPCYDNPYDRMELDERDSELHDCINRLPPIYQVVFRAFYLGKFSIKGIAQEMELPIGTVKRRLHKSRKLLVKLLLEND
jgi:RNA polymerase sigma-70 factor (ECF subfamily)